MFKELLEKTMLVKESGEVYQIVKPLDSIEAKRMGVRVDDPNKYPVGTKVYFWGDEYDDDGFWWVDFVTDRKMLGKTIGSRQPGVIRFTPLRYKDVFNVVSPAASNEKVKESSIDFPRTDLPSEIWDKNGSTYTIKPDVKDSILTALAAYPKMDLVPWADEIRLVGSLTSNQYEEGSDIDIHLVGDTSQIPEGMNPETLRKDVFKWFKDNKTLIDGFKIEVYIQLNPAQDYMSAGVYNLKSDQWEKGPELKSEEFNPYEAYSEIFDKISELATEADEKLGELKRDAIDYETIRKALSYVSPSVRENLVAELKKKLEEIEEEIYELMKDKKEWIEARKLASNPVSKEQALQDVELAKEFGEKNAIFKFLNRYQYMKVISELEKMVEDDKIDSDEVKTIQSLLGVFSNA